LSTDDSGFRERVRATSSNQRFLFTEGCPAFVAKKSVRNAAEDCVPPDFDIGELTKYWQTKGAVSE
jgi:hypothetical protein